MSYLKKKQWILIPDSIPEVIRYCPKCGKRTNFINSEKFRINANRNNIDIWLIYQCSKCKSTWNMSIYERINPNDIKKELYDKFLANDKILAKKYGFDVTIHNKNMSELILDNMDYHIIESVSNDYCDKENEQSIEIISEFPLDIRMDKFLSENLDISRSQIKNMFDKGFIYCQEERNWIKKKVKNGMVINIVISHE
ncbi:DUF1062 domain-containing protein [Anaerocolumna aminovalerica]|uniref:Uncharacterized protein n=1 Tax=Anaerocolumna aminovalerica TaxID=1527 RepID=A0A1I5HRZ5_9FIRM|nr:DUF1062 domain-containing protein [Anaerocolumna aminovalerica]MBU5333525.1 DUF1062 domain-containing protein [Anaerocolumna aminovalerica]MDU6264970.1 DUF1062 domain-containing protein [Anaerocolumna aminovalerica]SFO50601.1 hypothetical protein SAMN04489757_13318 [Anaerocolumna aminovalerica]